MTKFILNSLLCIFLCSSFQCLYAQEWAWSRAIYPNKGITVASYNSSIATDVNNNLLVAFSAKDSTRTVNKMFKHPKNYVIALCKYNEKGDLMWLKEQLCSTVNNEGDIFLQGMQLDSKGNIYITAEVTKTSGIYLGTQLFPLVNTIGTNFQYHFIAKFNANGEYVSGHIFKNCTVTGLIADKEDNILFLARASNPLINASPISINNLQYDIIPKGNDGFFIGRLSTEGKVFDVKPLLINPLGTGGNILGLQVQIDQNNNFILGINFNREVTVFGQKYIAKGAEKSPLSKKDIILAKLSSNLDKIWVKHVASSLHDNLVCMFIDRQNNIYWAADNYDTINGYEEAMQMDNKNIGKSYVAKMNTNAEVEWVKETENKFNIYQISQTKAGKILFAGNLQHHIKVQQFGQITVNYLEFPPSRFDIYFGKGNYFIAQLSTNGEYEWVKNWAYHGGIIKIKALSTSNGDIYIANYFNRQMLLEKDLFVANDIERLNISLSKIELCPQNLTIQKIDEPRCNTVTLQPSPCKDCTYEWLYDNKIVGTNATYTATKAGNYQLVAKKQFCTVTTNTRVDFPVLDVQFTVRQEVAKIDSIVVFPNPTTELVQMKFLALPPIALQAQSATKWTTIRWYYQGELLPQWNNQTTIYPSSAGVYEFVGTDEKGCVLRKNAPEIPKNEELKVEFTLYDGMGRTLLASTTNYLDLNQTLSVNMKTYQAGMYLLVAQTNKGVKQCYKIVKL